MKEEEGSNRVPKWDDASPPYPPLFLQYGRQFDEKQGDGRKGVPYGSVRFHVSELAAECQWCGEKAERQTFPRITILLSSYLVNRK